MVSHGKEKKKNNAGKRITFYIKPEIQAKILL